MSKVVIIGNGIAGISAARHIRKESDHEIIVIGAESKYFFSRTALMYVYMGHMKFEHTQPYENWFWNKNNIQLIQEKVTKVESDKKHVLLQSGEVIPYDKLILALGSKPRAMQLEGVKLEGVQSLYSKQDLELMELNTSNVKQAVVVGGGLIGIEMAEMLHSRGIHVTLVVREDSYWNMVLPTDESQMVNRHILSRGIDLKLNGTVSEIKGGTKVDGIVLDDGTTLECQFLGITIGVEANIDFLKNSEIDTGKGILVDEYLQTNVEDIYAIGDCVELKNPPIGRKAIEPVWYTGRIMGETAASNICHTPSKYEPGIWFNSAKFFDLEYQTYGFVPSSDLDGFDSFYWENQKSERSIRIVYKTDKTVVGIISLGIRTRHEVCENWIESGKSLDYALSHLGDLDFDPEFSQKFEKEIATSNLI
jgi:3-phenylpropionate/trans-cinnamate dioxygenase ferredoxin reductase subunit